MIEDCRPEIEDWILTYIINPLVFLTLYSIRFINPQFGRCTTIREEELAELLDPVSN